MSAVQEYYNDLRSTLTAAVTSVGTSLQIASSTFPTVIAPNYYLLALESVDGAKLEVVKVVAVSGVTLTVERGFEGTAQEFAIGDIVQCRNTAQTMRRVGQQSDLGETYPHVAAIVTNPLQVYIDPAGDDVNGDGSLASPWASLYQAVQEAELLQFVQNGAYVINCAPGTYPMNAQLMLEHPQGSRIQVVSNGTFTFPTGINTGDYSVDKENPTVPARGPNDLYNTAGTQPQSASLATRATARLSDTANNKTLMQAQSQVVFDWNSAGNDEAKIVVKSGAEFSNCHFTFPPQEDSDRHGFLVESGAVLTLGEVSIWGGNRGLYARRSGTIEAKSVAIANSRDGLFLDTGAIFKADLLLIQGTESRGAWVDNNSVADIDALTISGTGSHGLTSATGSIVTGERGDWYVSGTAANGLGITNSALLSNFGHLLRVEGNYAGGAFVATQGTGLLGDFRCYGNEYGVLVISEAIIRTDIPTSEISNNHAQGIRGDSGGEIDIPNGLKLLNNGNDAIRLALNSFIHVVGALVIKGNSGHVFSGDYCGKCDLGDLDCDLTNVATPHLEANGGSVIKSVAPGSGNVDPGIVYSPAFGTTTPPDSSLFTDTSLH